MAAPVIGTVHLNVANLDRLLTFYQENIGLRLHRREGNSAYLGVGDDDLLTLHHRPDLKRMRGVTGLYHFALLLPSRLHLGRTFKHLIDTRTPLQGMSDHIVSEAIYLADPEGNGIEIYRDRPREEWFRDGEMQLATIPMDVEGVLNTLVGEDVTFSGLPQGTVMGHIHLHVSDVPQAEAFYRDTLGMDVMFNIGHATFMSYDGYHHHVGANIWAGRNTPTAEILGLDKYVLCVNHGMDDILSRLDTPAQTLDDGFLVHDPSHNKIVLVGAS
jgi:catechol 2,3-dioxygenase